jgi:putative ABC transport system permease protein
MYKGAGLFSVSPVPAQTFDRIVERLQTVPGIVSVAAANRTPFNGGSMMMPFLIEGRPVPPPATSGGVVPQQTADYVAVTRAYFDVMGIPIRRGRAFDEHDHDDAPFVVIINETMAQQYFPNEDPVGKYMRFDFLPEERVRQVVGIAGDTLTGPFQIQHEPTVYVPHLQQTNLFAGPQVVTRIGMNFVVRTAGDPLAMVRSVKQAVADVERTIPVAGAMTLEQTLDGQVRYLRLYMLMLVVFGGVSVMLAAVGLYGVMAHTVAERTREIGIRIALGARVQDVLMMVFRHATLVIGVGLVTGLGASLALGRLIRANLFDVTDTDPVTYLAVTAVVLVVTAVACLIPTRRAAGVNPTIALKYE